MISLFYCFDRLALLSSSVSHHIQKFQFTSINSNFIVIFSSAGFIENSFVVEFRRMFIASPFFFHFYFSSILILLFFLIFFLHIFFLPLIFFIFLFQSIIFLSKCVTLLRFFFFYSLYFVCIFLDSCFFFYPATLSRHYVSQAKFPSGTPSIHTHTHAVHIIRKPHIELQRAIPTSLVSFFLPLLRLSSFAV